MPPVSSSLAARLRAFAQALTRLPGPLEQCLFRAFYRIPGVSAERKRRLVVWLHRYLPALTRGTYSYQLYDLYHDFFAHERALQPEAGPRLDATRAARRMKRLTHAPQFQVLILARAGQAAAVAATVQSLRCQYYPRWVAAVVVVGASPDERRGWDADTDISFHDSMEDASHFLDRQLARSGEDLFAVLRAGDLLTFDALLEVAQAGDAGRLLYADHDYRVAGGLSADPQFKPGFSDDLLLSTNFIGRAFFFPASAAIKAGGLRLDSGEAWRHDLLLRLTDCGPPPKRLPLVVLHCATLQPMSGEERSVQQALAATACRRDIDAVVEPGRLAGTWRLRRTLKGEPLVSIFIPFRDQPALLEACLDSLRQRTSYQLYEIIAIDNGSVAPETKALVERLVVSEPRLRVCRDGGPFNYSRLNNRAAASARGDYFVFLNNDTEVISPDWLQCLLEHAQRPEVGVVGARLLYSDGTQQHSGLVVGVGGACAHAFQHEPGDAPGYMGLAQLVREVSAVTFACAMTRAEVFRALGGLDEKNLPVALNDVDYCLRVRERGLRVIFTPFATLYHHESKSRGHDDSRHKQRRAIAEIRYMQSRHERVLKDTDPFYSPAFSRWDPPYAVRTDYATRLPTQCGENAPISP